MQCHETQQLFSASIDREIDAADQAALEAHLAVCDECRSTLEALRCQHADMLRAVSPYRQTAVQVAERVNEVLRADHRKHESTARRRVGRVISLMLAMAAGFLIAAIIFQPWRLQPHAPQTTGAVARKQPAGNTHPQQESPVAKLILTTGDVNFRSSADSDWQSVADGKDFNCSSGSVVRTGTDVLCELQTTVGCVIRMNEQTELQLPSSDTVEMRRGEIWCQSPPTGRLVVIAPTQPVERSRLTTEAQQTETEGPPLIFRCPSVGSMLTTVEEDGEVRVTVAQGEIELQTASLRQQIGSGQSVSIVDGQLKHPLHEADPILASRWIHRILANKGHRDAELSARVDAMLAHVGKSKLSSLYEQEIRSLGEFGVLPLLRYVESPISGENRTQRLAAMRLVADLAPTWSVGDLIDLLSDADPDVRFHAAHTLKRLTGRTEGREPDQWREPLSECAESLARWRAWWSDNESRYASPVTAVHVSGDPLPTSVSTP